MIDNKIQYYRERREMTKSDLSKATGFTVDSLSRWERCVSDPPVFAAICLAKFFGTTVEELFSP